MVKPRDLSFLSNFIHESIRSVDPKLSFASEKISLDFDHNKFALVLITEDNKISYDDKFEIEVPQLLLNLSIKNLFIAKISINNLLLKDAVLEIETSDIKKVDTPHDPKFNLVNYNSFKQKLINIQEYLYKVNFKNFTIILPNQNTISADLEFITQSLQNEINSFLKAKFTLNEKKFYLNQNCSTIYSDSDIKCLGQTNLIDSDLIKTLGLEHKISSQDLETQLKYQLTSYSQKNQSDLKFTLKTNKAASLEIINVTNEISYDEIIITGQIFNGLSLLYQYKQEDNYLDGSFTFSRPNIYEIAFKGNFSSDLIDDLWPKKAAITARKFVTNNVKADLKNNDFYLKLAKQNKFKLTDFKLSSQIENGELSYSKIFPKLTDLDATLKLDQNSLKIDVISAKTANLSLANSNIRIAKPFNKDKTLIIETDISGHPESFIDYLMSKNNKAENIAELKSSLDLAGNISGKTEIILPLAKKITLRDLTIRSELKFTNFASKPYLDISNLDVLLNKKIDDDSFTVKADCKNCNLNIPPLNFRSNNSDLETIKLNFSPIKYGIDLNNFSLLIDNEQKINGSGEIFRGAFYNFAIDVNNLGKNNLQIFFNQIGDNLFFDINGESLDIGNILENTGNSSRKNILLNGQISKVFMPSGRSLNKVKLFSKYLNYNSYLSYLTGRFDEAFVNINQETSNNKQRIIIETNDAGSLLNSLNITDKIQKGNLHLSLNKTNKSNATSAALKLNDFYVTEIAAIKTIKKIDIFNRLNKEIENKNSLKFSKASALFSLEDNLIKIKNSAAFSNFLSFTSQGTINNENEQINLTGVLVPAYKLNRLFGLADIPIIGTLLTGGPNQGVISPKYEMTGNINQPHFKINTLSVATPGFLRNLLNFSLSKTANQSEICLQNIPKNLKDKKIEKLVDECKIIETQDNN